jgi:hypothetical protein
LRSAGNPFRCAPSTRRLPTWCRSAAYGPRQGGEAEAYGRMVVAGALKLGEQEGVRRAVLYTEDVMARRASEALGFKRIGDYGVIVFAP